MVWVVFAVIKNVPLILLPPTCVNPETVISSPTTSPCELEVIVIVVVE